MRRARENILVMHTGGWIGDMILLTPALRSLKRTLPGVRISMLVNPLVGDLMRRNPYLDEVIVYDKRGAQKGIRQMLRMADRLRERRFDLAVILHPNSVRSAVLSFISGIPERIGARSHGRGLFLTTRVRRRAGIHEVQRYLDVISPIMGVDRCVELEFWGMGEEDEEFAEHVLNHRSDLVIGVNPFTTWTSKRWSMERFAHLIDLLSQRFAACVLLTGGPCDARSGDELVGRTSSEPLNLIGRTSLWQLGALIKRCDIYITCDSGPMHISAAVGTPTVALFGPTDPVRHGPYGSGHVVVRKDIQCSPCYRRRCENAECMDAIQVEDVTRAVELLLSSRRKEYA